VQPSKISDNIQICDMFGNPLNITDLVIVVRSDYDENNDEYEDYYGTICRVHDFCEDHMHVMVKIDEEIVPIHHLSLLYISSLKVVIS